MLYKKIKKNNLKEIKKDLSSWNGDNQALKILELFHQGNFNKWFRFGIVHQVNLEYLARLVFNNNGLLYPDSVVGTDSHTTMINGLGIVGWGVGGIEAEAVMLG